MYDRLNKCQLVKSDFSLEKITLVFYIEDKLNEGLGKGRIKFVWELWETDLTRHFKTFDDLVQFIKDHNGKIDVFQAITVQDINENDLLEDDDILYQVSSITNEENEDIYEIIYDINPPVMDSPKLYELLDAIFKNPSMY